MVIELKADVKHIDEKITNLIDIARTNSQRIDSLEQYRSEEVGRAKGVASTATVVSVVVSVVISVVAVLVGTVIT
jgi:CHASE3 domain sensor protein